MRIGREESLKILQSLEPGLADKEIIEQSDCLVFKDDRVCTFNDEIFCSIKSPWKGIEGAVKAAPLLELLSKLPEDDLDIEQTEANIIVKGKRRKAGVRMEQEIMLPVDSIEEPADWQDLPDEFSDAVDVVHTCASNLESEFVLTCVHIHPEFLEACDRFQIARYPLEMGLEEPILIRAVSLKSVMGLGMTSLSQSDSWVHFRSESGLVLSVRKYPEEYNTLDQFVSSEGMTSMVLPAGIDEVVNKAEIFTTKNALGNRVLVTLQKDRMIVEGEGASGWYKEMKQVKFDGDPVKFYISPKLLVELSKKAKECKVGERKLLVDTGKFVYITSLQSVEE